MRAATEEADFGKLACTLGQHDGWSQTRPHCIGGMQILAASMHMYLGLSGAADSQGAAHLLITASTMTWMGLLSVSRWMISQELRTISTALIFLPLLRPCIISDAVRLRATCSGLSWQRLACH